MKIYKIEIRHPPHADTITEFCSSFAAAKCVRTQVRKIHRDRVKAMSSFDKATQSVSLEPICIIFCANIKVKRSDIIALLEGHGWMAVSAERQLQ